MRSLTYSPIEMRSQPIELTLLKLYEHSETEIRRYVKIKGNASRFDGNLVYWSSRMGTNPEMPTGISKLLKKQKGKCTHCGHFFKDGDLMEIGTQLLLNL